MYKYSDGGREDAGFKGKKDCAVRAFTIATGIPYLEARKLLREASNKGRLGSRAISKGVYKDDMTSALKPLGWVWCSAPKFEGRKARYDDIEGLAILRMAHHFVAVRDGVLYDTFDSRNKMVYGYWKEG